MDFIEALSKLVDSKIFKDWKNKHETSYLTYGLVMLSKEVKPDWQIGYYNHKLDMITTFVMGNAGKEITKNPDSEVFKDKGTVEKLIVENIRVNSNKALEIALDLQTKKYPGHSPIQKMVIIQKIDIGQVWNITFITSGFKTLNIKIDSATGSIIQDGIVELFSFDK